MNPELSARLGAALSKLDELDPSFKTARHDERLQQLAKEWKILAKDIDGFLREAVDVFINAHQIGFDVGSDGGGRDTKPFIEEVNGKFPRLEFRLQGEKVIAVCNNRGIAQTDLEGVNFEFIESSMVTWLVWLIEQGGQ